MKDIDNSLDLVWQANKLAARLIAYRAWTQTITDLTGMSRYRVASLRRRLAVRGDARRHGPPPHSLKASLRSGEARVQGVAFATVWKSLGALRKIDDESGLGALSSLQATERVCDAYDAYQSSIVGTRLNIDEVVHLVSRLDREICLGYCSKCGRATLYPVAEASERSCVHCRRVVNE